MVVVANLGTATGDGRNAKKRSCSHTDGCDGCDGYDGYAGGVSGLPHA